MKKQLVYIHGGEAFSNYEAFLEQLRRKPVRDLPGNERLAIWTETLRPALEPEYEVFMPSMPNKQNARYLEWKIWFERYFEHLRDGVTLLGWSQGGYFLAKYLTEENPPFKIAHLILVAAPAGPDEFGGEDGGDFVFDTTRLPILGEKANKISLFHSTNDPVVPFSHAEFYVKALPGAQLFSFPDKGHFIVEELPELIAAIKEVR